MKTKVSHFALFTLIGGALFIYGAPGQAEPPDAAPAASPDSAPAVCTASGSSFVDDLEDGDTSTLDGFGGWYALGDDNPASTSTLSEISITPGGAGRSRFAARIAGSGFEEYALMGVSLGCSRDAGAFEGYRFAVKAGGTRSFDTKVATAATVLEENGGTCREGCNDHFFERVSLSDEGWHECTIRFCDLEQKGWFEPPASFDPRTVMAVEFIATDVDQPFDITIDNVELAASITQTACVPIQRSPSAHGRHHHGRH